MRRFSFPSSPPACALVLGVLSLTLSVSRAEGPPRPVAIWPAGPLEVRVAFDRPVEQTVADRMNGQEIHFHETTDAEPAGGTLQPANPAQPGGTLQVAAAKLDDAGRTLVLLTDPHPREAVYRLILPGPDAAVELVYDLSGVEVTWNAAEGSEPASWSGWWPHLEPEVARSRTAGSAEHEKGFALMTKPGSLQLRTLVALPAGSGRLVLEGDRLFEALLLGESVQSSGLANASTSQRAELAVESSGDALPLDVTLTTGPDAAGALPSLRIRYLAQGAEAKPLDRRHFLVGWAPAPPPAAPVDAAPPFDLSGGDPAKGEAVFFSDEAKCSSCHTIGGKGAAIGPDLSNLAGKAPMEIYQAIAAPSAEINPDYVPFTVATKTGQVAVGVVKAEGAESIKVMDTNGQTTVIARDQIDEIRPSSTSIMPVGLAGALGEPRMKDLIAFLLTPARN